MKNRYQSPDVQMLFVSQEDVLTASATEEKKSKSTLSETESVENSTSIQEKKEEMSSNLYDIYLISFNEKKLSVIQVIMQHCKIGLKDAKELVESCTSEPVLIKENLAEKEMLEFKNLLTQAGASVSVRANGKKVEVKKAVNVESSICKSKIFINGGKPVGTDCMGILMIDDPDKYIIINYSEAPIEVDVTPGSHFVVIGAGEHLTENTPSLRREFHFDKDTVLTVDIAAVTDSKGLWNSFSGDSDAVIRFQKITYAEYEKALKAASFKVTKKAFS